MIDETGDISAQALKIDRIHSNIIQQSVQQLQQQQQQIMSNTHISAYSQESKKTIALNEENSKNFTVKLYPADIHQNETQEMTMFVENSHEDLNTGRVFKIDLNKWDVDWQFEVHFFEMIFYWVGVILYTITIEGRVYVNINSCFLLYALIKSWCDFQR